MSGHSKWAQIKRQKGVADVRRGQAFTKLSNAITLAVSGVPDPEQNFKLRLAIEKARSVNMPKVAITRAIEKGAGKGSEDVLLEAVYEAFGPSGFSLIIEAATDKKLRTTAEVKNLLEKNGATMGVPGSVSYLFATKGFLAFPKNGKSIDDVFLLAADAGADDVEEVGDEVVVYTNPEDLTRVKDALQAVGITPSTVELMRKPLSVMVLDDPEVAHKAMALVEKLEAHDDVQKVYTNFDVPEALITDA